MITTLDEISREFVRFASTQIPRPALDIGAAFGVATHAALSEGVPMIANDIDGEHLDILIDRTPLPHRSRVKTVLGVFPDEITFPQGTFSAVLLSRVMHFFDGPTVERSISRLHDWLATGGKAFVVVESSRFLERPILRRTYEKQKAAGQRWPGFVRGVKRLLPKLAHLVPDQLHYLDPDILSRAFEEQGFIVEAAKHFNRVEDPSDPENAVRQSVGLIARKP